MPLKTPPQPLSVAQIGDAHLTNATVVALTGLSDTALRRLIADGKFPPPISPIPGTRRFRAAAVTAWLREKGQGA